MTTGGGLRELSRRAVQSQIAASAEALFIAQGFEETTVDEIAAAVGMSQRSFFRYFASKDDVILDNLERLADDLAAAVAERPDGEPEWDTLRRAFDPLIEQFADRARREHGAAVQRIIEDSPRLLAAYLQRLDGIQQRLTDELMARDEDGDRIVMRAVVGSAFACLHAAISHVACGGDPERFGSHLDRAMTALRPALIPSQR
ncbi:TetR/AcrR family transcriptional regulator [Glycomyces arizonensis]|uniref:TetR/AcrR family transcriptional regulator n=1 Tax=Glycomyces arizonensis TaxID=256035 RepID=UPI000400FA42|nr:TetR/AcrR family transcriptional regulator [Glycomyces arizonensis]